MTYKEQERDLLKLYLDTALLPYPTNSNSDGDYFLNENGFELIVRPQCNQHCSYCYIANYGKELYPTVLNKKDTLKNIDLVLDYVYNIRKNFCYNIALFAGDMFNDEIFFDIIDLLEKYLNPILIKHPEYFHKQGLIQCPCNLRWVYEKPQLVSRFRKIYYHFKNVYNIYMSFSWSTDGLPAIKNREKIDIDQHYFDTIFQFTKEFGFGYHPMISAENIDVWCENIDWWYDMYKKFDLAAPGGYYQPYMLEVRNGNWTPETIELHNKFLEYFMKKRFELCGSDKTKFVHHLLIGTDEDGNLPFPQGCDPLDLKSSSSTSSNFDKMSCGAQSMIHFNCTNLSLVFCHRMAYPLYTGGYFKTDEEKNHIIDIDPYNVSAYITMKTAKTTTFPLCAKCKYFSLCKLGCLGAQTEDSGEPYMPIKAVCAFNKVKYEKLIDLYYQYGVYDIGVKKGWLTKDKSWLTFIYNQGIERGYINE